MLNKRLLKILNEFVSNSGYLTSSYLSKVVGVTPRTIRSDLKELDKFISPDGAKINSSKGIGYKLEIIDDIKFSDCLKTIFKNNDNKEESIPILPEERVEYIIRKLLETDSCITLEELCDELFISTSTIKNDLKKVKSILQRYRLVVASRLNKGIRIEGKEIDKRFCMAEYFFNRSELERIDLAEFYIENIIIFNDIDLRKIEETLMEELAKAKLHLADIALKNLIIHIAIAIKRIKESNYITQQDKRIKKLQKEQEYTAAINIVVALERNLGVSIPNAERYYVAIHLLGSKLLDEKRENRITEFIDESIKNLISKILKEVNTKLALNFIDDNTLICGLALHLKPAFHRIHFNMNLRNPWLDEVKTKYPLAFQAGVITAKILENEMECSINENEIGYLAMHFGGALERKKKGLSRNKKIAIICSSGMGSANLLLAKLKNSLNSNVNLIGTYPLHQLEFVINLEPDIILTTVPIKENISIPSILVNAVLEDSDLDDIKSKINNIDYCENNEVDFEDLFAEDLFFTDICFETKEKVIEFLTNQMVDKGYINDNIKKAILDREKLSSTAIGNLVAIPHPLGVVEVPSCVSVGILKKPIDWDEGKKVQIVMVLSISKDIANRFADMFGTLYQVTKFPPSVVELIKQKNFESFYDKFLSEKEKV